MESLYSLVEDLMLEKWKAYKQNCTDSEGNNLLTVNNNKTVLYLGNTYTFYRLNDAEIHPFYISDAGYKKLSTIISLSGDGTYDSGITGTQSFTLSFNTLNTTNPLYYYCSLHQTMVNTFELREGPAPESEPENEPEAEPESEPESEPEAEPANINVYVSEGHAGNSP